MVMERGWNFAGHLGDQTWMTGSAFRCGTSWLNTIVSKGRRVWEEGCEISPQVGRNWVTEWNAVVYPRGSKSVAGVIL